MGFILSVARSVAMAFMTFSRIPMPHVEWEERSMRYLLAAFPLVGVVVALVCALWANLAAVLGFAPLVLAAGLVAIPLLVTGGIHLDGFCDVSDALSSHAEPERKCQIMKDPHVGAFSVMSVGLYLIVYVAVCSDLSLDARSLACICAIYPTERCLSGLLCLLNPKNSSDGMVSLFKKSASQRACVIILACGLLLCAGFALWANWVLGLVGLATAAIVWFAVRAVAKKQFGGVNGDVAGFFLQMAELAMLAAILLAQKVMML